MNLNKIGRKLFLDDVRKPTLVYPETLDCQWIICKNYNEFVASIERHGVPEYVSFDHDLSEEHYPKKQSDMFEVIDYNKYSDKTGYDCAKWLVEKCMDEEIDLPTWGVHSMNPVGRMNIASHLMSYTKFREKNKKEC